MTGFAWLNRVIKGAVDSGDLIMSDRSNRYTHMARQYRPDGDMHCCTLEDLDGASMPICGHVFEDAARVYSFNLNADRVDCPRCRQLMRREK